MSAEKKESVWPRVGLVMIVRDEEAVIERALRSAIPWIQTYVIVDTGSTDRTKEVIRRVMGEADISGSVVDRPWVNFGHNRTEALELCRDKMEWAIMLDADDNLGTAVPPRSVWDHLELDAIAMRIQHNNIYHNRLQIFRVEADWTYQGVVHEYPVCRGVKEPKLSMLPTEYVMESRCAGVRSRDPQKYLKDAAILEEEHARDPKDMRTLYYLAQSYRDAGRPRDAAHYYRRYVEAGGSNTQELYVAMMNLVAVSDSPEEQLRITWAAINICPERLEAGYTLMRAWRMAKRPLTQQVYAIGACCKGRKANVMWPYVNPMIYEWAYDEEFAVVAANTGHLQEAYDTFMRCAVMGPTAEFRESVIKNARIVREKLVN